MGNQWKLLVLTGWLIATPALAQTSYPMVMSLHPIAAQTGQSTEHEIVARYDLSGAYQVFVSGTGVTGEVIPDEPAPAEQAPDKKPPRRNAKAKLKVRFIVAADALPGPREFRVATPHGVSTVGQMVVVRDPIILESDSNNSRAEAQLVTLPATLCGSIEKSEDVDWFKFQVEAGTSLSFVVQSARLQNKIHDLQQHSDPILTLRNSAGTTLAQADNDFLADPCLRYTFSQSGEYFLEIRDVRYLGNADWRYSIEINARPLVTQVYPLAVTPGADKQLELVGFQLPMSPVSSIQIPMTTPAGPMEVALPMGGELSNPVALVASALPADVEVSTDNNTVEQAQPLTVPAGISGRIESEADVDYYVVEGKKGDVYEFEIVARRVGSSLDSLLRITNEKLGTYAENDDARTGQLLTSDSIIESWKAPADGRFYLEIRDLHLRGGPEYVYFLRVARPEPTFHLTVDTDKTILTPGTNGVIFVRAARKHGFKGEIQLGVTGLPAGVTATCGRILPDGIDGCIVLQAATGTPLCAANIQITGTGDHAPGGDQPSLTIAQTALPLQEIYLPGGGRGHYPVLTHTVSVGEHMDLISVKLSQTDIRLKPGESQKIDVTIERAPGFTQNITLDVIFRHLGTNFGNSLPKGVTLDEKNSQTLLQGGQNTGSIVLTAAKDAPAVEKQLVSVMANVSLNFVMKMTYAAEPLTVTVEQP